MPSLLPVTYAARHPNPTASRLGYSLKQNMLPDPLPLPALTPAPVP
jgi:hypothetical protein